MERDGLAAELKEFTVKKDGENIVQVVVLAGKQSIAEGVPHSPRSDSGHPARTTLVGADKPEASGTPAAPGTFGLNFNDSIGEEQWGVTTELNVTVDVSTIEAWFTPTKSYPPERRFSVVKIADQYSPIDRYEDRHHSRCRCF